MKERLACSSCDKAAAAYRCPVDKAPYCSVACFKLHKGELPQGALGMSSNQLPEASCRGRTAEARTQEDAAHKTREESSAPVEPPVEPARPLKRLRDLRWPAEPDLSLWDDPLNRDIPKPLTPAALEAIATSPALRTLLDTEPEGADRSLDHLITRCHSIRPNQTKLALRDILGLAEQDGVEIPTPVPTGAPLPRKPLTTTRDRPRTRRMIEVNEREKQRMLAFADLVKRILEAHKEGKETMEVR